MTKKTTQARISRPATKPKKSPLARLKNTKSDQQVFDLIDLETRRQKEMIGLIPSENHISPAVAQALGSASLSDKYSEGYVGRRYYEGNQIIDEIETLAIERLKKLFGVPHVNVQPYSGSPANSAVEFALLEPGETLMGQSLYSGGHLTHGHPKVTFSGRVFKSVQYGVNEKTGRLDYDEIMKLAQKAHPKLIIAGSTAYPFTIDFRKFRQIADSVGAYLLADISHICGLVVAGEHQSPVPYADVIMSTTHKTFRGPRGAMILVTERGIKKCPDLPKKIDSAVFPGLQGGPHNATIAALAIAAGEASGAKFRKYGQQIVKNAQTLAGALKKQGIQLVGGGTQNHLLLVDLSNFGFGLGKTAAIALDAAGIYANANSVPGEKSGAFYPSGLRLGTPLVTTRGMKTAEMKQIALWIDRAVRYAAKWGELPADKSERAIFIKKAQKEFYQAPELLKIRAEVKKMASKFPLFQE